MDKLGLGRKMQAFQAGKPRLMKLIANNAVNFFKVTNFNAEAFVDVPNQKWAPRKSKKDDAGRRLLVKTGHGRQSIHTQTLTGDKVTIVAEAPYMKFHNEGTKKLPKRQFMGKSEVLDGQNLRIVDRFIKSIL